jgi:hypothetical protein
MTDGLRPLAGSVERLFGREIERDPGRGPKYLVSASIGSRHTHKGSNDAMGQNRKSPASLDHLISGGW